MIPCPKCGERTAVIEARLVANNVRRRRKCDCGNRFTTLEQPIDVCQGMWIRRLVENEIADARGHAEQLRALAESLEKVAEAAGA